METEEEVDILMSSDVYSATLSTKSITFSRAQTGWLFREDKTVCARCCFVVVVIMLLLPAFSKVSCGSQGSTRMCNFWNLYQLDPGRKLGVSTILCMKQEMKATQINLKTYITDYG